MSAPLVFIEVRRGQPTPGSLGLLTRAREIAGSVEAVICGTRAAAIAADLQAWGADRTFACESPGVDAELAQPQVDVLAQVLANGDRPLVMFENSTVGADVAAGLAARLDAGVNWDLQDVELRDGTAIGTRLALNDSVAVKVGWTSVPALAVMRLGMFEPTPVDGKGEIEVVHVVPRAHSTGTRITQRLETVTEGGDLTSATVVVAGGRGVRDRESLALLEDLAAALGGVAAVSMPLVDRGWYPHSRQVGQTGTKVRPRLYVACGISGQLAHRVGMEKSGVVVAINSDASAPIFGMCDAGVVGDLHEVVPELTRLIRERAAHG